MHFLCIQMFTHTIKTIERPSTWPPRTEKSPARIMLSMEERKHVYIARN